MTRADFGIVGHGAVGALLVRELAAAGESVLVWNRSGLAEEGVSRGVRLAPTLAAVAEGASALVLCVTGSALPELDALLAGFVGPEGPEAVLHTCGALPPGVLGELAAAGVPVGLCHPLTSIPPGRSGSLVGAVLGLRGEPRAIEWAERLARSVRAVPVRLRDDDRAQRRYHAAASMVSGGLAALVAGAAPIAADALGAEQARRALAALAASVAHNLSRGEPAEVATGPVPRGAAELVEVHLAALSEAERDAYRLVGRTVLDLVGDRLDPAAREALRSLLD